MLKGCAVLATREAWISRASFQFLRLHWLSAAPSQPLGKAASVVAVGPWAVVLACLWLA